MVISRRAVLITGGAAAVIGGIGAVGYSYWPGSSRARAPWSEAGTSFGDPRLDALAYAILAPNPHNRQPWVFELIGESQVDVRCDLGRRLPHTDPFDRQITIGFGCMLELLRQAAAEKGWHTEITPFPDGEPQSRLDDRRIASIAFVQEPDVARDPLFTRVLQRRSLKEPYDPAQPVSQSSIDQLVSAASVELDCGGTIAARKVERLIDIAKRAWIIEYETTRTRRESIDLMRIGNRAIAKNPDGIDVGGAFMGLMKLTGFISPKALDTPGTVSYQSGIDMYEDLIVTAQGFIWVKAGDNTRRSQIAAGQSWVRINLAAQKIGLGVHPLSQCLQEFPEMTVPYKQIHEALGVSDDGISENSVVHMLGRVGYAAFTPPSPRWPLESKLVHSNA